MAMMTTYPSAPAKWLWPLFAVVLLAAPLLFPQSAALSILSQSGCMMILALSFNMLLGQSGMLSFGHALYAGLPAFVVAHMMNRLAGAGAAALLFVPLLGGGGPAWRVGRCLVMSPPVNRALRCRW
jgi:branched-chain amino acid transport system permease protein